MNGCTYVTAQNSTGSGKNDTVDGNMVNLQDLYPGENYTVSLFYDLESEKLLQCSHRLTLGGFTCSVLIVTTEKLIPHTILFILFFFLSFCFSLKLVPNSVSHLRCKHHSGGYGLAVTWDYPNGVVNMVQVVVGKQSFNQSYNLEKPQQVEVKGLQAAQWYTVTATSFSGDTRSQTVSINCQTDPAGKMMSRYLL